MFKKICVSYLFAYILSIKDRKQNFQFKNSFTRKPLEFELQNILRNDKKKIQKPINFKLTHLPGLQLLNTDFLPCFPEKNKLHN